MLSAKSTSLFHQFLVNQFDPHSRNLIMETAIKTMFNYKASQDFVLNQSSFLLPSTLDTMMVIFH